MCSSAGGENATVDVALLDRCKGYARTQHIVEMKSFYVFTSS